MRPRGIGPLVALAVVGGLPAGAGAQVSIPVS